MEELQKEGFRFSVDDFGTGYSAMNYLVNLPTETVKIDMSLVQNITQETPSDPVLFAVVSLLRNLDKTIIAEGIETEFQEDFLDGLSCDFGQGYLYSKPMPEDEVIAFLDEFESESVAI
jgi:EAL domain-containing protein (putative c-di-GMP-specific phosphodiesterase class I)